MSSAAVTTNSWELYNDRQRWMLVFVLFLVASSGAIDRAIIAILLEPIKQEFHVSDTALGLMTGVAFGILYAVLGLPIGRYADHGNRRWLITASVAIWSVLTAASGRAGTFFQLFLFRIGVGIGEAGGTGPPLMSLLSDYFPPERRAQAVGFIQMSSVTGAVLGLIAGGYIAQYYGWRTTMILAGLPGLLLAAIAGLALREPRARHGFSVSNTGGESIMDAFRALIAKPTFINITLAYICFQFVANGPLTFSAAYTVRVLHMPIGEAGLTQGLLSIAYVTAGNVIGGVLADRLSRRDIAWLCRIPGYGLMICFPFYVASFLAPGRFGYTAFSAMGGVFLFGALPPIISGLLAVVGSKRRATGYTISLMLANLLGVTVGPLVTGALSDTIGHSIGAELGLRWGIIVTMLGFFPTGWFLLRAARTIRADFEI